MLQICVYCASSDKIDPKYFEATDQLATAIIEAGATTIYGGGARGLMGRLADQILEKGGTIIGVIPEFMKAVEWDHPNATEMRVVPDMHTRKRAFLEGTGAIVALPGGCGTFEELLEAITWKRLGLITCPIIVVNTDGYYDPLITMLDRSVDESFMRAEHRDMWTVIEKPSQLMEAINNSPGWDKNAIGFAAV